MKLSYIIKVYMKLYSKLRNDSDSSYEVLCERLDKEEYWQQQCKRLEAELEMLELENKMITIISDGGTYI